MQRVSFSQNPPSSPRRQGPSSDSGFSSASSMYYRTSADRPQSQRRDGTTYEQPLYQNDMADAQYTELYKETRRLKKHVNELNQIKGDLESENKKLKSENKELKSEIKELKTFADYKSSRSGSSSKPSTKEHLSERFDPKKNGPPVYRAAVARDHRQDYDSSNYVQTPIGNPYMRN